MAESIQGLAELTARLKALEPKLTGQIGRPALRAGAKIIQAAEKRAAPRGKTKALSRAPKVRAVKRRAKKGEAKPILVSTAAGTTKTFYSPFVEWGHAIGRRKTAKRRGRLGKLLNRLLDRRARTRPVPFIKHAFDVSGRSALAAIENMLRSGLEKLGK